MIHDLPHQLPWFVVGPTLGLLIVGLYALTNKPLGASGAYVQSLNLVRHLPVSEPWRIWYFSGILAGAIAVSLVRGTPPLGWSYGALGHWLPLTVLIPLLLVAGTLVGYGARWMGGCTSGHGLCGTAILSPASFAATGTFFGTAVIVTAALHVVSGGAI
ncbi:MAG: YeeE/YedE thiosulfate transporter family protein [Chloroflexota bacterium]